MKFFSCLDENVRKYPQTSVFYLKNINLPEVFKQMHSMQQLLK